MGNSNTTTNQDSISKDAASSTTTTTTVKDTNLPIGPVPSNPSSIGTRIAMPLNTFFFESVSWTLDGEKKRDKGNNQQMAEWRAQAEENVGKETWKTMKDEYDLTGWVLVGTATFKAPLQENDIVAIGVDLEDTTVQLLSVGKIQGIIENSKVKFLSSTAFDLTPYVKGETLVNTAVKFPQKGKECPSRFGKNACNGIGGPYGVYFQNFVNEVPSPTDPNTKLYAKTKGFLKVWKWLSNKKVKEGTVNLLQLERKDTAIATAIEFDASEVFVDNFNPAKSVTGWNVIYQKIALESALGEPGLQLAAFLALFAIFE